MEILPLLQINTTYIYVCGTYDVTLTLVYIDDVTSKSLSIDDVKPATPV